ncbi:hypothetical protein [Vibrio parahaemolyticus]|uniref:hypothetical protein n=1 Tax=Vibrio parahaemolyticus TaxID=670 RepID=UPI0003DFAA71|nr:hypothetical protein [Vibrio parahaemolyticus]EGQ8396111.1 hypothetical protein [Vibrio parahaemolyticus]EGQ9584814.1 hypothetical protein [Vibrio parahaemolyticus]EGR1785475.1 hypothetical protein [Vibrio parahaemolyticus]EGR2047269.1 hypothetical protein [Vibrio parahaemolyticus]EGR2386788.1 hypothetical protein [Vibrio parahaemolyticus]
MNKNKIIFSIAMMFSTLATAADINSKSWEYRDGGIGLASKSEQMVAIYSPTGVIFSKLDESCYDLYPKEMVIDVNAQPITMYRICDSISPVYYYPKSSEGRQFVVDQIRSNKPLKIMDNEFRASNFKAMEKVLADKILSTL